MIFEGFYFSRFDEKNLPEKWANLPKIKVKSMCLIKCLSYHFGNGRLTVCELNELFDYGYSNHAGRN